MKHTKHMFQFFLKNFLSWFIIVLGWCAALLGVFAFQSLTTNPSNSGNQSLGSPMLSKSGSIFNRNYHSLEAIANALGLPSEGSGKKIFITRQRWQWNLGWLSGADAKCQAAADARSLGGTWKAILSDGSTDAISRLTPAQTIFNIHGEIIAYNPLWKWLFEQWKAKTNSAQYEIRWPLVTDEYWVYYPTWVSTPYNYTTITAGEFLHFWSFTTRDGIKSTSGNSAANCSNWSVNNSSSYAASYHWVLNNPTSFDGQTFFQQTSWSTWSQCPYSAVAATYHCQYCDVYRSLLCQEQ